MAAAVEADEDDAALVLVEAEAAAPGAVTGAATGLDRRSTASTAAFLRKPDVLTSLQRRLQAQFLRALPASVQRRIRCLKNIQRQLTSLEAKFYEDVHLLEMKYHEEVFTPYYEQRELIVKGEYQPTASETDFPLDYREEEEMKAEAAVVMTLGYRGAALAVAREGAGEATLMAAGTYADQEDDDVVGVPEFWLTVFKNIQLWNVSNMVQEHDEPALKHLEDIRVVYHSCNPMGFTLEFHFSPNEYFTNPVLTKLYEMRCEPDAEDPFSFEGPDICKCKGCAIDWRPGMNLTVKLVRKQRESVEDVGAEAPPVSDTAVAEKTPVSDEAVAAEGTLVSKEDVPEEEETPGSGDADAGAAEEEEESLEEVACDSFFNFFSPPHTPKDPDAEIDEETQFQLASDFAVGHYIRERIVPRAVLYYTGDALINEEYERNIRGDGSRGGEDMSEDFKSEYSFEQRTYANEEQPSDAVK